MRHARLLILLPLLPLLLLQAQPRSTLVTASITTPSHRAPNSTALQERTRALFQHAYVAYKTHALPFDELRPLSCTGVNTFGNLSISLVDSLDTLAVLAEWPEFIWAVRYIVANVTFDQDVTISLFETTIRILGGLLSAHGIITEHHDHTAFPAHLFPDYDDALLLLATDLADRLMPAFNTTTGIPFGAVNLRHGISPSESLIASTAGAGSLLLEFGVLTRYTRNPSYYNAAYAAMSALHARTPATGLVGNHIHVHTGAWVATDSGVGGLIDSFYEYMLKGYILFGDRRLLRMFERSYVSVQTFVHKRPWYLNANMDTGHTSTLGHSSLSAFWPGLQTLLGELEPAVETTRAHYAVWRRYGALPEGYHVQMETPVSGQLNYPLRPELVESVFYHSWATDDPVWQMVGEGFLTAFETVMKVPCGFAEVSNVATHELADLMHSFVMSETFKYLFLLFADGDSGTGSNGHWLRSGRYVLSTEAHPFRIGSERLEDLLQRSENDTEREMKEGELEDDVEEVRKCKRRPNVEYYLPNGYSMPGTDIPTFDLDSLIPEPMADDVSELVQRRVDDARRGRLRVGEVFVGRETAYRVARVAGVEAFFARLSEGEFVAEVARRVGQGDLRACRRVLLREMLNGARICSRGR